MGKVKAWLMDMEEDAMSMTREEWCDKHGESLIEVYNEGQSLLNKASLEDK